MKKICKKIVVILSCMSLSLYAPVGRGPKKGSPASYSLLPSEEINENSSDKLFAMTFDLVEFAVKQKPVLNLSLYYDKLVLRSSKKEEKTKVVQAVDQFFKDSLIVPNAQEKKDIILNAQILQAETKTNAYWPFKMVPGSALSQAAMMAEFFFVKQLEFIQAAGQSLADIPAVSYDFIEGTVKFNTAKLFEPLPDYSKGLLVGNQSLQDLYQKYITYMVQKQVDALIKKHENQSKITETEIFNAVAEKAADIDESSENDSEKEEKKQELIDAAIPALAENIALTSQSDDEQQVAAKSVSQELADLISSHDPSRQIIEKEEAQIFEKIMEQIKALQSPKSASQAVSLSSVIDLISHLSAPSKSAVDLVSVIEVVDALRMQRARV